MGLIRRAGAALTAVPASTEAVPPRPARVVARNVQTIEVCDELVSVSLEPLPERDRRRRSRLGSQLSTPLLDPPVPRTDVLADVTAVDAAFQLGAIALGNRRRSLCPVR